MVGAEIYAFTCSSCGRTGYVADNPGDYLVPVNCPDCGELGTALPQDLSIDDLAKVLYFLQVNFSEAIEAE